MADTAPWPAGLVEAYPSLATLPPASGPQPWQALSVAAGTLLFEEHAPCQGFPLVLDGEVRVARGSAQGRSLELYRVGPGELCVVSACGLFGQSPLAAHGVAGCVAPRERFDSEALLELPELATGRVAGKRVAILRGDGGRELLAETLRARGAEVDCITCYRRSGPADGVAPLLAAWRAGKLDALTVSSSEGLRYLVDLLDGEGRRYLQKTPVFVPHARIAESARALGLSNIILTAAADAGILAGLGAYNWSA